MAKMHGAIEPSNYCIMRTLRLLFGVSALQRTEHHCSHTLARLPFLHRSGSGYSVRHRSVNSDTPYPVARSPSCTGYAMSMWHHRPVSGNVPMWLARNVPAHADPALLLGTYERGASK